MDAAQKVWSGAELGGLSPAQDQAVSGRSPMLAPSVWSMSGGPIRLRRSRTGTPTAGSDPHPAFDTAGVDAWFTKGETAAAFFDAAVLTSLEPISPDFLARVRSGLLDQIAAPDAPSAG